tara:strand:+ start:191 stop:367 length:177 start_codon:yes stop_codon:yes gene_type:complete
MTDFRTKVKDNLGQIEMMCCGFAMIWISDGSAICLKCAIEKIGVKAVSQKLKQTKTIS